MLSITREGRELARDSQLRPLVDCPTSRGEGIAPSEVMHLLDYLRRAGVSVKRIGSTGFSVSGSPVHLEALTVLAMDELRTEKKGV